MKTSTIEIQGLLSVLSARGVEKQLLKLPGMRKAEVNFVAGSATVVYDETAIDLKAIKARVQECGYHCSGERMPKHICVPDDPPAAAVAMASHVGYLHGAHAEAESTQGYAEHATPGERHAMAHELNHGGLCQAVDPWQAY